MQTKNGWHLYLLQIMVHSLCVRGVEMSLSSSCTVDLCAFSGLDVLTPTHPPLHFNPHSFRPSIFRFLLLLPNSVLSEEAAWLGNKSPDIFFLKNTISTKAMINTHNWNKWQLTAENHLPAVGGRKLLTAVPHWVATKREELVEAEENTHHYPILLWGSFGGDIPP
jgi:hypothetical protein